MNIVTILANGVGARFGSNIPKQFHKVNGKMIIEYVIESILSAKTIDKIVIATNIETNSIYLNDICTSNNIDLIDGGLTRNETLKNVIDYINCNYNCNKLIVCDAVRPLITGELIDKYFTLLDGKAAVVTAQKITDSLGCYDTHQIDRERFYLMQSPEAFDFKLLTDSFDSQSTLTEVTQQLPNGSEIELYFDFNNNIKLTYPADLKYLEAILKARDNNVDFSNILFNVTRLSSYLKTNYPRETYKWEKTLESSIQSLLKRWQIIKYEVIKTSHFGIIFLAESIKYGKCVLKIIPPFINRYSQERSCYQNISANYMCDLYDFDDSCSAILMERCFESNKLFFNKNSKAPFEFFKKVINANKININKNDFNDYKSILNAKKMETNFNYKNDIIINYINQAIDLFNATFKDDDFVLIHGDLHRYNIMEKNEALVAIDPIGYIAPAVIDIARYIGTELTDGNDSSETNYEEMIKYFSELVDIEYLKKALFIDIVFRLHNSLFENENYNLTDKWLNILEKIHYE